MLELLNKFVWSYSKIIIKLPEKYYISSHGSYALWSAYLAGGDVIVADGYYSEHQELDTKYPRTLFPILAAKVMNWTLLWDRCYKWDEGGVLTDECEENKAKYGIED